MCLFEQAQQQITPNEMIAMYCICAISAIRVLGIIIVKFAPKLKCASKFNAILAR